ncbi:Lrp/AsnC family transcriptional regulator [Alisedimentitalea sp. MJ-SS2]|uniref:Lrp/AsnC family transcriptional regulator n=1 Tax=Aliisedimentitalea sp. MJ-SS2 TaxID=3049795 RepID=UPI002912990B|nr:Lrp/AsnC family transcriptional regulator [Alisedimentitalea sp. MJ-SS2]MDU8927168.1 Lrp/AsnC family transcriptional regulator [Alisedimentitalea sp. MJ-SS2]
MLDDLDRRLLRLWQASPELNLPELAEAAGITPSRASRRIDKLREAGVVKGLRGVIDWRMLGYEVEVSLRVTLDKTQRDAFDLFLAAAREIPQVTEIQTFLGKVDVRLAIIARDMAHYQKIYRDRILALPHIADIEALVHVAQVKAQQGLPL